MRRYLAHVPLCNRLYSTDDPANAIGVLTSMQTLDSGLLVSGQLSIDESERAMVIYSAMLDGRISEWSVGYAILAEHFDKANGWNSLDEAELL